MCADNDVFSTRYTADGNAIAAAATADATADAMAATAATAAIVATADAEWPPPPMQMGPQAPRFRSSSAESAGHTHV